MRKKNKNYQLFKKANCKYLSATSRPNIPPIVTSLRNNKNLPFSADRESAQQSKYANKRGKNNFYNSVNSTLNNFEITAKKKFSILNKLLRKYKSSSIPPLIENDKTVTDPKEKVTY